MCLLYLRLDTILKKLGRETLEIRRQNYYEKIMNNVIGGNANYFQSGCNNEHYKLQSNHKLLMLPKPNTNAIGGEVVAIRELI